MEKKPPHSEPAPSTLRRAPDPGARSAPAPRRGRSRDDDLRARGIAVTAARCAIATDADNRIVCWNPAAGELFGLAVGRAAGRNLQQVIDARDTFGNRLCSGHCAFHEMVREGESPESFELDVRTASGQRLPVAVSIVVVLGPDCGRYELVYLMTPLRRRRRADEAIDRVLAERSELGPSAASGDGQIRPRLSVRQREVLRLLASGLLAREIADVLSISVHTVRSHLRNIFVELGVSSQVEAVAKALRERLI